MIAFLFVMALAAGVISGQAPPTRPVQLPLATGQQSGVSMQQSAAPAPTQSVNTLSTRVQVQGAYAGSSSDPNSPSDALVLTLPEAIQRGLRFNLGKTDADLSSQYADAQRISARSALLPEISGSLSENAARISLEAEGFGSIPGINLPPTVGPFHYYDAHASLQQKLMDFTAVHNYRSTRQLADAAGLSARQAREEVVLAVTGSYLQLMATIALIEQQRVEVQYAEASYKQAREQADAGNKAPIDANRSKVELQTEEQRLRSQLGDLQKQKNQLARLIGLSLSADIQIKEKLDVASGDVLPVDEAVRRAWTQRDDLKAAETQLSAAEEARKAASAEHLPSITVNGEYGIQGVNPYSGNGIFEATASLNFPIFNGGRIHADVTQASSVVSERRAELSNARGAVELEVRDAYIDLTVANDQVKTAESNRTLALETLKQSQDRFVVGVADSVEVVNSQQTLAAADHDYVSSLFSQHLAKVALAHAMGEAEKDLSELFKGSH